LVVNNAYNDAQGPTQGPSFPIQVRKITIPIHINYSYTFINKNKKNEENF